jgi:GWxTD domain-containing protein
MGIEFISESINDEAKNLVLIPYSDLFFQLVQEERIYRNKIEIAIYIDNEEIVFHEQFDLSFSVEGSLFDDLPLVKFNREYYPLSFETELEEGSYMLHIGITGNSTSKKREYREEFSFPGRQKEIGYLFLTAELGGFLFVLRDQRYLYYQYDSLQAIQTLAFQPDSTFIVIDHDGEVESFTPEELDEISSCLDGIDAFNLRLEYYYEDTKYISSPIYPNPAYFFQNRYSPQEQLAQLRYIVNQNEYNYLKSLSESELQQGINEYWLSKDPDPYTLDNIYQETFYQRIRYVNNNYRFRDFTPGWRTDMGRIYIIYGEPDHIVNDVFPIGKPPSITWHYYSLNKVFVFYDLRGYGHYELKNRWMD